MGQVYGFKGNLCSLLLVSLVGIGPATLFAAERDARQLTHIVSDLDGTVAHNLGHFRVRRAATLQSVTPFFHGISSLPEEVLVPTDDFEGNVGWQIKKRLGRLDERGQFIPSTSVKEIVLSNGQTIIPAYYYLDSQTGFREFRERQDGGPSYFVDSIQRKIQKKDPFLLEGFNFLSAALQRKFSSRVQTSFLTMRGNGYEEWSEGLSLILKAMKLQPVEWPPEAFANLSHPDFYEFGLSKTRYLESLFGELSNRMMTVKKTPHFLVFLENDRHYLKNIDTLFKSLANRGVFANPVVPILVNYVEEEVLRNPNGIDWDRSPMQVMERMSKVTIYWPGQIERTDKIERVLELTLGITEPEAKGLLKKNSKSPLSCKQLLGDNQ
jgi:hypothetical protein